MLISDAFTSKFILRLKMPAVFTKSLDNSVVFLGKRKRIKGDQAKAHKQLLK